MRLRSVLVVLLCLSLLIPGSAAAHGRAVHDPATGAIAASELGDAKAADSAGGCHDHPAAATAKPSDAPPAADCCSDDCHCGCLPVTGCSTGSCIDAAVVFAPADAAVALAPTPAGAQPPPLRPPIA